jgi:8-oxo-dGTP pyrophosphatase MutT (NUDIX family)
MTEGTAEPPLVERDVVRLVVLDSDDRILLLHVRDLANPAFGTAWELPGGGREPGETLAQAAIRELREETGLEIRSDLLDAHHFDTERTWRRDVVYTYRGKRRLQHEVIVAVRLQESRPLASAQGVDSEAEDLFEARWWTIEDIQRSDERFYPRSLAQNLRLFLAGAPIEEALEVWP